MFDDVYCVRVAGVGWIAARGAGVDEDIGEASAQLALKSIRDPVQGLSDSTRAPNIMLR